MKIRAAGQKAKLPYPTAQHVDVSGACPKCDASPWRAQGAGDRQRGHDTIDERCRCLECGAIVGRIVVTVDTIFGIEEDERVLNGRCRVY